MIKISKLTKDYDKECRALENFSLEISKPEIIGLAGPNGAGKTTLLRILATLLKPTSGNVTIFGLNTKSNATKIRNKIGYLSEQVGFYNKFSGFWNLKFNLSFYGINIKNINELEHIDELRLTKYLKKPVGKLSFGMKKKLALLRILAYSPDIFLLDEPMNSLDVESQLSFKEIMLELKKQNKIIIMSTHVLHDIEDICDRIIIINFGKKLIDEYISNIKKQHLEKQEVFNITDFYMQIIKGVSHYEKNISLDKKRFK